MGDVDIVLVLNSGWDNLNSKYGMRLMRKEAGLGSPTDGSCGTRDYLGGLCVYKPTMTKCGQETYGDSVPCGGVSFCPLVVII